MDKENGFRLLQTHQMTMRSKARLERFMQKKLEEREADSPDFGTGKGELSEVAGDTSNNTRKLVLGLIRKRQGLIVTFLVYVDGV